MPVFFISYRRADGEGKTLAHALYRELTNRYGAGGAFLDVEKRRPGVAFPKTIQEAVDKSEVMLVVMGSDWLRILHHRRNDKLDWVRFEIARGLGRSNYPMVPVLALGARIPAPGQLPKEFAGLNLLAAEKIDLHENFKADLDRMLEGINQVLADLKLADSPQDRAAWEIVRDISKAAMEQVDTGLPGNLHIRRTALLERLDSASQETAILAIVGPSGSGKTALTKLWVDSRSSVTTEKIWLTAADITRLSMPAESFFDLLSRSRRARGILVLDGAEHWSEHNTKWVALAAATIAGLAGWKLLITSQEQPWHNCVSPKLNGQGLVSMVEVLCNGFSDGDITALAQRESRVAALAAHEHLRKMMRLPQMLHIMVQAPQKGEVERWASEADVVAWWWQEQVCGGKQIAKTGTLARDLASSLADQLATELPESEAIHYEEEAELLRQRGVLFRTRFGQLRFVHDLYADWSRVQCIQSLGTGVLPFMREHIENPPWFRSLAIHCQQLLETAENVPRWVELIRPVVEQQVAKQRDPYGTPQIPAGDLRILDAALEAIVLCSQPGAALERVRDQLLANRCSLLRRLLRCLNRSATQPNHAAIAFARMNGALQESDLEAAARGCRIPRVRYWIAVIHFLHAHRLETVPFIAAEVAAIMPLFESLAGNLRPEGLVLPEWWDQWCELAVQCGERELCREIKGDWQWDDDDFDGSHNRRTAIYKAALLAGDAFPDRVAKLALKAVGRAEWEEGDLPDDYNEGWVGKWTPSYPSHHDDWTIVIPVEAWEHGPRRHVSSEFADVWLDSGAMTTIRLRPEIAREVTLAALIDWPRREISRDQRFPENHWFRRARFMGYPPFWHRGPFLPLLKSNWECGLQLIVTLVNFATDRAMDWYEDKEDERLSMVFETVYGKTIWKGHQSVYGWHCDLTNAANEVTSALMALEKWLMDSLAAKLSVDNVIEYLFKQGRSIAFAGLLLTVGKAYPTLLLGPLRPLLFKRRCYVWDAQCARANSVHSGAWSQDPAIVNQWRRDWWTESHRRIGLQQVCLDLIACLPETRELFGEVASKWVDDAARLPTEDPDRIPLLRSASEFDFRNWRETGLPDGRSGWQIVRPPELSDPVEAAHHLQQLDLMQLPFQAATLLDARKALTDYEATAWWQKYEQLAQTLDMQGVEENESVRENPQHALSAVMAVLLCLASEWIAAHPAKLRTLEERARHLAATMKGRQSFTSLDTFTRVRSKNRSGSNPLLLRGLRERQR